MISSISRFWSAILDSVYPSICQACKTKPAFSNLHLCISCYTKLELLYHLEEDNDFINRFEGRLPIAEADAMFIYTNSGVCQALIKAIKYHNRPKIAYYIGKLFGEKWLKTTKEIPDIIIPVPLHRQRLKQRTYNQSEYFALGIASVLKIQFNKKILIRKKNTLSQTTMNKDERFENIAGAFKLKNEKLIFQKNVMLVDDVITTGSTLESCGKCLLQAQIQSLSLACIALGKQ